MFNLTPFNKGQRSLINDFFNDDFFDIDDNLMFPMFKGRNMRADIKDNGNAYEVEMDIPGIDKNDIQIDYVNNNLIVTGKRQQNDEIKEENYIRRERSFGEFRRAFYVDNVNENEITASFNNGVLNIILPKLNEEQPKGHHIEIQ